jgi:hypothetical protein
MREHTALAHKYAILAATLLLCACLASSAGAAQSATISAGLKPERLGAATTLSLGFQITSHSGEMPSPLTAMDFSYPANLGLATTGLGVAACAPARLEAHGASACPPDSIMGSGNGTVEIPESGEIIPEGASIALVAGPSRNGDLQLLIAATGISPVAARIVMPTLLAGGHLNVSVPLIPSLPEGPDIAIVRVHVTLGGNLTYYERVRGRTVAYHPTGVALPSRCPRGGFRFGASFAFLDGERASARTVVACPRRRASMTAAQG